MKTRSPAPFSCTYSSDVPDILAGLGCSLLLSTYQAGKLILLSPGEDGLVQLPRNFKRPMGTAVDGNRIAVATQHEVILLENTPALAATIRRSPRTTMLFSFRVQSISRAHSTCTTWPLQDPGCWR